MSFGAHSHFLTLPTWKGNDTTAVCQVKKLFSLLYCNINLIIQLKSDDAKLEDTY
jgi:hypothetical protein